MDASLQPAAVAGHFYPADAGALAASVDASLARAEPYHLSPKAVIAPHAGYVYSGDIAGTAYRMLARRKDEIRRVILMGPNHRVALRGMAVSPADAWATPLGPMPVDRTARDTLGGQPEVTVSPAPFAGEHSLEVHLPFIRRALGEVEILPILVGQTGRDQVSVALGALWGGPETAIVISSDLSHYHDYETCRRKDQATAAAIERLRAQDVADDGACGRFAIRGLLDQAQRRDLRITAVDVRNSGDTRGDRDRVVGYGAFAFEYAHSAQLDADSRRQLLGAVRDTISRSVSDPAARSSMEMEGGVPRLLRAQRASFVTLTLDGELRGCQGTIIPCRSLFADVVENARKAAFSDPRFPALAAEELEKVEMEISILSTPRRIPVASEAELARVLRPDTDGLILRDANRRAVFLPSVWGKVPDPLMFIRHLKRKAGLPPDHWSATMEAFRFRTESFGEGHA